MNFDKVKNMLSNFNKSKNDKSTGINNSGDGQNNLKDKK